MAMLLLLVLFVVVSLDCDSWRACSSEERSCVFLFLVDNYCLFVVSRWFMPNVVW